MTCDEIEFYKKNEDFVEDIIDYYSIIKKEFDT